MTAPLSRILVLCVGIFVVWSGETQPAALAREKQEPAEPRTAHAGPVDIQMKNVNFRLTKNMVLEVRTMRGQLRRTNPQIPVTFDDSSSFILVIDSAEVGVTAASLTELMNSYVLAYKGAPIKNVEVTIKDHRFIEKGTVHKGIDLAFEIEGSLSPTDDGNIRMHAEKIKSVHVPVKGLLHLFGEDLSKLVNQNAGRGMKIVGDDIILTLRELTPPPHFEGRVTRVAVADGRIVEYFDSNRHLPVLNPPFRSDAYIYHRGGVLRFGKLIMNDADLEIVGDRPGLFDFFQREYLKQLVAGYSKTTPENGLVAHMVDYSRVH